MLSAVVNLIRSSLILKLSVVVLIAGWLVWLWNRRRFYMLSWKLPGPVSLPIIGNAIELGVFGKTDEIINVVKSYGIKYPSPFNVWLGPDFCVVVTEPEDLEVVLLSKATSYKDKRYDLFLPVIGPGLLSASGPLWKMHRQMLNPVFRRSSVRLHQDIYNKHSLNLIRNLNSARHEGVIDVAKYCKRFTGDVVAEALFELKMDYYKGDKDHFLDITTTVTELVHSRMTKFWQENDFLYSFTKESKIKRDLMSDYRDFFYDVMRAKLNELREDSVDDEQTTPIQILAKGMYDGVLSEKEVLNEFDNIYNPGMDTTYSQVSAFMLILGMHKQSQDKLWNEIREFYKNDMDREVQWEDLNQLPYLDMCIKELIRLFPTGPIFIRRVTEDLEMKKKNITVPVGSFVIISLFLLHRNVKYWDDPDAFIPERFGPDCSKKRPHFAFLPFSAGQRNCVAQHFAVEMLKTAAVYLMRRFEFSSDLKMEDLTIKADISVRSNVGYKVTVKERRWDL